MQSMIHYGADTGHGHCVPKQFRSWRRAVAPLLAVFLITGSFGTAFAATTSPTGEALSQSHATSIPVALNGKSLTFDVPPIMVNDRVLVPFRAVLESMGANVWWDAKTRTAYAFRDHVSLRIPIDSRVLYRNNMVVPQDVPSMIVRGRTMITVRFVSEALGAIVRWEGARGVSIQAVDGPDSMVSFVSGDGKVPQSTLDSLHQLVFTDHLVSRVADDLGLRLSNPITVYVAQDNAGYSRELQAQGITGADLTNVLADSGGLAVDHSIFLPMSRNTTTNDQLNTITHELTHVLLNDTGAGYSIPSWVNEGLAWREGLNAEYENQPKVLWQGMKFEISNAVEGAYAGGTLVPLISDPSQTLAATQTYNVEWQDYLAVDQLIQKFGMGSVRTYLTDLLSKSPGDAFKAAFGETTDDAMAAFNAALAQAVKQPDQGVQLTFTVSPDCKSDVALLPRSGSMWRVFTLAPGNYTVTIKPDGTIEGLTGGYQATAPGSVDGNDVFLAVLPQSGTMMEGMQVAYAGIAITYGFGQYGYTNSYVSYTNNQTSYANNTSLFGVTLTSVTTPGVTS